jgi:hypothetical protein
LAYYTALIAAWNNVTQPPPGVTGTGLLGGDTTAQKITKVNAWTVTGSVPTVVTTTGAALLNCINWAEFNALTAAQQSNLLELCSNPGPLLGGSANVSLITDGMFLAYFTNHAGPTIANLTALAQGLTQMWWQAPVANNGGGLTAPVSLADTTAAGLV